LYTSLEWAVFCGQLAVVRLLIDNGAITTDINRLMELAISEEYFSRDRLTIVSLLLEKWGGIEALNKCMQGEVKTFYRRGARSILL
jgi:ankyrin repeat protein